MTWTCQCPREQRDDMPVCTACLMDKPEATRPSNRRGCADCGDPVGWMRITMGYDGVYRCASCHMTYLGKRAAAEGDRCTEPGCDKTAAEHIGEFRRIVTSAAWTERFETTR